ncbi:MAG: tetratricopeptide repeat protein [Myxococcota bacterium]
MTRGPRRLKDDPDFKWETGCDVANEDLLVGQYDLPGLRSRIVAAAAVATPLADPPVTVGDGVPGVKEVARSGWVRPVAGLAIGALVFLGAYWLGAQSGFGTEVGPVEPAPPIAAPAPVGTSDEGAPTSAVPDLAPAAVGTSEGSGAAPAARVAVQDRVTVESAPAVVRTALEPVALATAPVAAPPQAPAGTADEAAPRSGVSDLPAQQAAFDAAQGALSDGRYRDAQSGFEAVLERWPTGALAIESEVGLLHALWGSGDYTATLAQAEKIQKLPALSSRGAEITRLRAESLVLLNRCEEALLVAEQLSDRRGADIRKACRTQPKESTP